MAERLLFHWQAMDEQGALHLGYQFAAGAGEITLLLEQQGYLLLRLSRGQAWPARRWKQPDKAALIHQLATLLKSGLPLADGLKLLAEGHPQPCWQGLLLAMQRQISQGEPFSRALAAWPEVFPPLFTALIHTGELTGALDECCQRLAEQQERQQLLHLKVRKALRYPLIILAVALLVSSGMLLLVLPQFVEIYQSFNTPLPAFTAAVIACSELLQRLALPLSALVAAAVGLWRYQRRRSPDWQRKEQRCLLRLPLIAPLWRGSQLSMIFTTLSLTQRAGLTLLEGLQAVEKTLSPIIWREAVVDLQRHISAGRPLHQGLSQQPLFTALCCQMVKVGEESGALDELLGRLAENHENQTQQLADALAATLEPLLMVVIGVVVGTLVVAMYLPVFNLGEALG